MRIIAFTCLATLTTACATLNDSMTLGGSLGAVAGGISIGAAQTAAGKSPSLESVALGAGVGMTIGLIASYFTHKSVADQRETCNASQTDMQFGDLPPSPFVFPKTLPKKGAHHE